MNQRQQNNLSMKKAVRNALYAHRSTWDHMKPFVQAVAALDNGIKALDKAAVGQAGTSIGITVDKASLAYTCVVLVMKIAANVRAYALDQHNNNIYEQMNYSRSTLLNMPDNEQLATLHMIVKTAENIGAALVDYKVTAASIAVARKTIDAVSTMLPAPRIAINARSTATLSFVAYEEDTRLALEKLDNMIHNFEKEDPVLVSNYKHSRIVVDNGMRHRKGGIDVSGF